MSHPYFTLNISESADDNEIRQAYMEKIKMFPPESHASEFQQINEAYEAIKTAEDRATLKMFGKLYHRRSLEEMAPTLNNKRSRPGTTVWLNAIKAYHDARR